MTVVVYFVRKIVVKPIEKITVFLCSEELRVKGDPNFCQEFDL